MCWSTYRLPLLSLLLFLAACKMAPKEPVYAQPAFTDSGIHAVIEIPAGTNHKIEYNLETKQFEVDVVDGKKRVIDFLPYPANYGFIPSTMMSKEKGGDGDALDILVISESQATGTLMDVKPIAALELLDGGEVDTKIIAIPIDSSLQIIKAQNFETFLIQYNGAQRIIENWFLTYKGLGKMELVGWKDETYALNLIKKWSKKEVKN